MQAINLATGVRRLLVQGGSSTVALSPDDMHIAEMVNSDAAQTLRLHAIDGTQQREWPALDPSGTYDLLGWLNADEILLNRTPKRGSNESQTDYANRFAADSTLLAFNIQDGTQETLLQGLVGAAFPSPDGHYVAIKMIAANDDVTLEIRPLQAGALGNTVATLPHMTFREDDSSVVWTSDSQQVVFWARGIVDPANNSTPFDVMTLDGHVRTIGSAPGNAFGRLLAISPDGRSILYAEGETGTTSAPWAYWQMSVADGTTTKLMDGGDLGRLVPVQRGWFPIVYVGSQGGMVPVVTSVQPFYLPKSEQRSNINSVISYVTQAYDQSGQSLGPLLDEFTPHDLLAWLPDEALAASPAPAPSAGSFQSQIGRLDYPPLNSDSRISPDGSAVLSPGEGGNFSMAISLNVTTGKPSSLAGAPDDPSWLPDGSGVIGVQRHSAANGSVSRISIFGDSGNGTYALTDFDPAELGGSYRRHVSPADALAQRPALQLFRGRGRQQ